MFKNITIYRLPVVPDLGPLTAGLAQVPFTPCGVTQERSSGWTPPRGQAHGPLVESINGHWLLRWTCESKQLPASVLQHHVDEKAQAIEQQYGRKPGKRERRDLAEEARLELLPHAFTRLRSVMVWIDPECARLVIGSTSSADVDSIIISLVEAIEGVAPTMLNTAQSPASCMAQWLADQEAPPGLDLADGCELKTTDETRAGVRYTNHALEIEQVREHIQAGKRPTWLGLYWDSRIDFVLTDSLRLRKIVIAPNLFNRDGLDEADQFDADAAIVTAELRALISGVIQALGGEA